VRIHHLDIALGPERSRFEERLLIEHTASIHVLTCDHISGLSNCENAGLTGFDVVQSVGHSVNSTEEFITVDIYRYDETSSIMKYLTNTHSQCPDRQVPVCKRYGPEGRGS
jgi:hypothetical protein